MPLVIQGQVAEDEVTIPEFSATIAHALGLPLDHITYSPERRPFTVAKRARPILKFFGVRPVNRRS